jgi:ribosomal protein S16
LSAYFVGVVCLTSVHFLRSTLHERGFGQKVEFGTSEVYYKPPVTEAEAREVGVFLSGVGFFDPPKTVQVLKQSKMYEVRFVLKEGAEANPEIVTEFTNMAGRLSRNVFGDAEVEVQLCDDRFKTIITKVTSKDAIDFGRELSFGKAKLFFKLPVTESEARRLGEYLVAQEVLKPDSRCQIAKQEGVYQFRFLAKEGIGLDQQFVTLLKVFASQLSQNVFEGAKVEIHLCDERLKTVQVVVP